MHYTFEILKAKGLGGVEGQKTIFKLNFRHSGLISAHKNKTLGENYKLTPYDGENGSHEMFKNQC